MLQKILKTNSLLKIYYLSALFSCLFAYFLIDLTGLSLLREMHQHLAAVYGVWSHLEIWNSWFFFIRCFWIFWLIAVSPSAWCLAMVVDTDILKMSYLTGQWANKYRRINGRGKSGFQFPSSQHLPGVFSPWWEWTFQCSPSIAGESQWISYCNLITKFKITNTIFFLRDES